MSSQPFQPIAITGLSALFPQAKSLDEFWRLILSGRDCMQPVPATHWLIEDHYDPTPKAPLKTYANRGAFLSEVPFDPVAYGLPPTTLPSTDVAQLLSLLLARAVLDDASGGQIARLKLDRTSVILGVASATELISSMSGLLTRPMWIEGMRRAGVPEPLVQKAVQEITALFPEWTENTFPGCLGNVVAGRVANRFNLGGTNCVTDAACASSLAALHMGVNELQLGLADRVISGGVDALNSIFMFMCFSQTPAMSASGKCSPFSAAADGTMMGEGGGMLCLRRLADAERDGDQIYAVLRGIGSSSDGRAKSVYAPRPEGQVVALQRCYELAGYSPASVQLIEAHGTGTAAGDACEAAALKDVFSAAAPDQRQWCALGSVKSQIGHTKGAAGTAGLIKAALALRHRVFPPTANVDAPNPALGIDDSPFYLSTKPRPWIQREGELRRASVSSFGFGGTNFHVALEEYRGTATAPRVRAFGAEVFVASGADAAAVQATVQAWTSLSDGEFARRAQQAQGAFESRAAVRAAVVAASASDLAAKAKLLLDRLIRRDETVSRKDPIYLSFAAPTGGGLAYLFPGQGSQTVGMAAEVLMQFEPAMRAWENLETLTPIGAASLSRVVFPPPALNADTAAQQEATLRRTENAQPALGAVSLSYLAVLEAAGLQPQHTAGHSFGEIPALYAAGVIGWEDCVHISRKRGELMAAVSAETPGAMTAVLHPADEVLALVSEFPDCVVANLNSPKQLVLAGATDAVERVESVLAARGITFKRLPVATAFHSSLVAAACPAFEEYLRQVAFVPAAVPVYHNSTAAAYPTDPVAMRTALAQQLAQPVRFSDQVRAMHADGARVFVEVGPGSVLTGLVRQTLGDAVTAIALNPAGVPADVGLLQGVAQLAVAGFNVCWDFLWDGYRTHPAPEKLSSATLQVGGYNLGRPYPAKDGRKTPPVMPALETTSVPAPLATPVKALAASPLPSQTPVPVPAVLPPSPAPKVSSAVNTRPPSSADAIARAHETFLRTMSDAHRAFLEAASGRATAAQPAAPSNTVVPPAPSAVIPAAPVASAPRVTAMPMPETARPVAKSEAMPTPRHGPGAVTTPPAPAAPAPAPQRHASENVIEVVLKTVAEKTGYPRDMLEPSMLLEGDLGIDSIKRVEILSAVQKQLPNLPPVDAKVMGGLQTLQAISDYLIQQLGGAAAPGTAAAPAPAATAPAPTATGTTAANVIEVVLKTVAEKTGYPRDMLEPSMLLEGDLGIDSIKRVEILSAVQKQLPNLPPVDAKVMGGLQTLQAISDYLIEQLGGAAAPASAAAPAPAATAPAPTTTGTTAANVIEVVLKTVAEKTGYPRDMLEPSMLLEGDLGIDSIKRVEILSAVQKQLPNLPPVDAKVMGGLQTLQAISDYLIEQLGEAAAPGTAAAPAPTTTAPAPTATGTTAANVIEVVLKTVAEKTGYPRDMLEPSMLLEGDLGIDSIKRVEILSAVQKQLPNLPPVDAKVMGGLQTLQAISDYLIQQLGGVPAPASAAKTAESQPAAAAGADLAVERFVVTATAVAAPGIVTPRLTHCRHLAIVGEPTIGSALAQKLSQKGCTASTSTQVPPDADGVILLHGLRAATSAAASDATLKEAFQQAKLAAPALTKTGGVFIVVQDTGGTFGLLTPPSSAWSGALAGLAKTAAKEWPNVTVRSIDLERGSATPAEVATRIADELLDGGDTLEAGLRAHGERVQPTLRREVAAQSTLPRLTRDTVVVATGGARGVTASTLIELARQHQPRIALLGRTKLVAEPTELGASRTDAELRNALLALEKRAGRAPSPKALAAFVADVIAQREIRATLAALKAAGSEAAYFSCDTTDAKAVETTLTTVRAQLGPIAVLVHGAGVLADKLITDKTNEQFARVFDTKVAGLRALLDATRNDDLRALVLFSSVAGRFGNRGQVDYAMANELLNKTAHEEFERRGGKCLVRSLNWGPWEGGMVTPELRAHFAAQGIGVIPRDVGAKAFVRELEGDARRDGIEVVIGAGKLDLGGGAAGPVNRGEIVVSLERFPCLADHVVKGRPVVPIALATEWLLSAAALARPDVAVIGLRDVQVVKAILLETPGEALVLQVATEARGDAIDLTLRNTASKQLHYKATALYGAAPAPLSRAFPRPAGGSAFEFGAADVYDGRMFHGPAFQVIRGLGTWSASGAAFELENRSIAGGRWHVGPALLDGLMQAAAVWTLQVSGKSSLPMRIAELRFARAAGVGESLTCELSGTEKAGLGTVTDAHCVDATGAIVCSVSGVECFHVDSYWTQAVA